MGVESQVQTWPRWKKLAATIIWPVPEAVDTVLCTPDDGCEKHPKHVEWPCSEIKLTANSCILLGYYNIKLWILVCDGDFFCSDVSCCEQNQLHAAVRFVTLGSTCVVHTDIHLRLLLWRAHFLFVSFLNIKHFSLEKFCCVIITFIFPARLGCKRRHNLKAAHSQKRVIYLMFYIYF